MDKLARGAHARASAGMQACCMLHQAFSIPSSRLNRSLLYACCTAEKLMNLCGLSKIKNKLPPY